MWSFTLPRCDAHRREGKHTLNTLVNAHHGRVLCARFNQCANAYNGAGHGLAVFECRVRFTNQESFLCTFT